MLLVRHSIKQGELAGLKTEQSRRTYRLPTAVTSALKAHKKAQATDRLALGYIYQDHDLVFARDDGQPVHRDQFRIGLAKACKAAGIPVFSPREMRHTFVSHLSDSGMSIEEIAAAVGHKNSHITETVYRHQIRDEISSAAVA